MSNVDRWLPAGRRIAKGGRYDDVGEVFGRARGATGFDIDLKYLSSLVEDTGHEQEKIGVAPTDEVHDAARWEKISELRKSVCIVVEGETNDCNKQLVNETGEWVLKDV